MTNNIAVLEKLNAIDLFEEKTVSILVNEICEEYRANVYDITDENGRKALADDAKTINKWSKGLDDLGKKHVGILKAKPKLIDVERKNMRDILSGLRTEILQPLTNWEDAEKKRINSIQHRINDMRVSICGVMSPKVETLESAKNFMLEINNIVIDDSFEEFQTAATNQKNESELMLAGIIAKFITDKTIADAAAKLQAEKDAKARLEHEELIRRESADIARKEAEAKAEREKQEILAREQKAKQDALDAIDAAKLSERRRIAAEERAKLEQEQAIQAEKDHAEKTKQNEINAAAARARNTQHKGKINRKACNALIELALPGNFAINETQAELIISLIYKGLIPNVSIKY